MCSIARIFHLHTAKIHLSSKSTATPSNHRQFLLKLLSPPTPSEEFFSNEIYYQEHLSSYIWPRTQIRKSSRKMAHNRHSEMNSILRPLEIIKRAVSYFYQSAESNSRHDEKFDKSPEESDSHSEFGFETDGRSVFERAQDWLWQSTTDGYTYYYNIRTGQWYEENIPDSP
jgi:hypothetical protein